MGWTGHTFDAENKLASSISRQALAWDSPRQAGKFEAGRSKRGEGTSLCTPGRWDTTGRGLIGRRAQDRGLHVNNCEGYNYKSFFNIYIYFYKPGTLDPLQHTKMSADC